MKVEIICSACGAESLLLRKPRYEGLKKVGDTLACASCGHEYASEDEVPYKGRTAVSVFTDADRSAEVNVFDAGENERLCCYCASYVVNPFTQWCSQHKKEVEATDTCADFSPQPDDAKPEETEDLE